jgi:hypothetical protein
MKRTEMFRRSDLYGDNLDVIDEYGALDTPEGKERLGKIAVITDAEGMPGRHLPLYPVRRWRKSLDDLAEAISLAERGTFLAGRAVRKCQNRLADAEANLDGYLDKIIKKYHLEEAWRALSSEGREEFDRLLGRRYEGPTEADLNAQFEVTCSMQDLKQALRLVTSGIKDSVSAATRFRAEGEALSLATAGYDGEHWRPWRGRSTTIPATVAVSGSAQVSAVLLGANVLPKVAVMPEGAPARVFLEPYKGGMPLLVIESSDTRESIITTPRDDDELFE